jgi:hypothetical protein
MNGIKFGRYKQKEVIQYLSSQSIGILNEYIKNNSLYTFELFKFLVLEYPEVREILRRTGLKIDGEIMKENGINSETIPIYPLNSVRSLLVYAVEESLLTNSKDISPEHIFLAVAKIFPAVEQFLQNQNLSLNVLRETVRYRNYRKNKAVKAEIFNPDVPYYSNGGIGNQWIVWVYIYIGAFQ